MSKLPIAALYPAGSSSHIFDAHNRIDNSMHESNISQINRTIPAIILANNNNEPTPVTLCVDGALLWLLLAWITAGTAAIITLLIKSCRSSWKQIDQEEFRWNGLEANQSRSVVSQHTRSTSCSSAPSFRHISAIPVPIPTVPSPPMTRLSRSSTQISSSRRTDMDASRRHKHRSRRLQSTTA